MNRKTFFDAIRKPLFGGSLSGSEVAGLDAILDEAERRATPLNHLAYILATPHWETGRKMQPVEENLNYQSAARIRQVWPSRFKTVAAAQPYVRNPEGLANKVYGGRMGNKRPGDGWRYRGKGMPQTTGFDNYAKFGLADDPDRMLELGTSVRVLFDGMTRGMFTGRKLADYIGADLTDYRNARRIINGIDNASEIAANALTFQRALEKAGYAAKPAGKAKDAAWPLDAPSMPDVAAKPADGALPVDLPDDLADPVAESANAAERKSVKLGRWIVLFLAAGIGLAIWKGLM